MSKTKDTSDTPRSQVLKVNFQTTAIRFNIDGPVCVLNASEQPPSEKDINDVRNGYAKILDNPELLSVSDDLSDDKFAERRGILGGRFGLVICGHILEHIERPWKAAPNIEWLMRPGGHLRYTGAWIWGYRPYPDDYWRMSISALRILFPNVEWLDWWYLGTKKGVGIKLDSAAHERTLFQQTEAKLRPVARQITDGSTANLKIEAIGRKR